MAQGAVRAIDSRLLAGLVVKDAHRDIAGDSDILQADGPTAALVQIAFIESADLWIPPVGFSGLHINHASQIFAGADDAKSGTVDKVVVAGMRLPDLPIGPEFGRQIKDGFEGFGHDVISK